MASKFDEVLGSSSMSQSVILGDGAHNMTPNVKARFIRSRFKEPKDAPYQHECYRLMPGEFYLVTLDMIDWLLKDSNSPFYRAKDALEVFDIQAPKVDPVKPYVCASAKSSDIPEGYPITEWDAERLRLYAMKLKGFPMDDGFRMASVENKAKTLRTYMNTHDIKPKNVEAD